MAFRALIPIALLLSQAWSAPICQNNFCSTGKKADASAPFTASIAVKLKNIGKIEQLFWEISDPKSPKYGKYLTHEEAGELASNPSSIEAVKSFLISEGVTQITSRSFGTFIEFTAPLSTIERIFEADFLEFTHEETMKSIRRSVKHTIPFALVPHVDYIGRVSDFSSMMVKPIISTETVATTDALVTPSVLWDTYDILDRSGDQGSTAVFEDGQNYSPADLATFEKQYSLPASKVADVIGPNDPSQCATNPNACGEASLDVQYIISIANDVPLTYWAVNSSDQSPFYDWIVAVQNDPNPPLIHSVSYGEPETLAPEATLNRTNSDFQLMGLKGLTIVISSGDDGVASAVARGRPQYCGFNPSWPATSPYVLAVGATQFKNGSPSDGEIPCQKNNTPPSLITTGGGFSALFPQPSYQAAFVDQYLKSPGLPPTTSNPKQFPSPGFNKYGRGYPDVAALGHNYQVVIGGHTYSVDGTSASAPVTAGMLALINSQRLSFGKPSLGFANPLIYQTAAAFPIAFNNIATGNNGCTASTTCCTGFNGASGWDPLTGLGTPNFAALSTLLS